ncbi:MAG: NifU family protein [Tenuifilaceae bacterium]|jgi:Fe-S cluster biogenesis protein NfuA|uniref:NifU family protein n=1 Tax=Perlabentimonas gracilis TaxID=2715279 RepID=UPI001C6312FE|nr:NifU family protein [Perlabentimonas gracilis]MDX9768909.1 NifU family protein [Tenuifilaceae bacterium]
MSKEEINKKVSDAIELVRPFLQNDGGDISLVEVTDDLTVKVELHGACGSCPYSLMTLKNGVEQAIRRDVPEIKEVVAVNM